MINRLYIPFYSHQKYINCSCDDFGKCPECGHHVFLFFFKGRVEEESNSQQAGQSLFFSELKQPFAAH